MRMTHSNRVGILGGGQLSQMLIQAANKLGIEAIPLVDSPRSPAARVSTEQVVYAPSQNDPELELEALDSLFSKASLIIFENEFVDCTLLALSSRDTEVDFVPRLSVIRTLQDKLSQKRLLGHAGIPTAPFEVFAGGKDSDSSTLES